MRTAISRVLLLLVVLFPGSALTQEISLYDSVGEAVAYIDSDDELNIYLWRGKPVAYLEHISLYGFNGKHLGWFKDGGFKFQVQRVNNDAAA